MRTIGFAVGMLVFSISASWSLQPSSTRAQWSQSGDVGIIVAEPRSFLVIKIDGTVLTTVSLDSQLAGLELTGNGSKLAYATQTSLTIMGNDGSGKIQVEPTACINLHWSSDGSKLFYMAVQPTGPNAQTGQVIAYVVNSDGSGKKQIYAHPY